MAEFSFKGLDEVTLSMREVAELPTEIIDAMLNAGADVAVEAQRAEARRLGMYAGSTTHNNTRSTSATNILYGQTRSYSTGATARSLKVGNAKLDSRGNRVVSVFPVGSRTRGKKRPRKTKNTEIAFLNEFGARTINARRFIRTANEKSAAAVEKAEFEVYDKWLKSKDL